MRPAQLLLRPHWESGSGTAMLLRGRCVPGLGASPPLSPSTMFRLLVALRPTLCARSLCLPPCACPCAAVPRAPYSLSPSAVPSPVRVGTFVSTGAVPVRRAACAAAAWRGPWRARGREGARAFGCTEARGDALPAEAVSTRVPGRRMKKKVALWLGYVGTRYKGPRALPPHCPFSISTPPSPLSALPVLMSPLFACCPAGLQIQRGPGSSPSKFDASSSTRLSRLKNPLKQISFSQWPRRLFLCFCGSPFLEISYFED